MKSGLEVSYKVKYTIFICPSNFIPKDLSKRNENIGLPKYRKVHSSVTHNSQKWENTQISINKWVDQQTVLYACSGMLHSNTDGHNLQKRYAVPKKSDPKKYTYHMIPFLCNSRKDKSNLEWHSTSMFALGR